MKLVKLTLCLFIILSSYLTAIEKYSVEYVHPDKFYNDSYATSINNQGQVTGIFVNIWGASQPFLYSPGKKVEQIVIVEKDNFPVINNLGEVAGIYSANNLKSYIFIYRSGKEIETKQAPEWKKMKIYSGSITDDGEVLVSNFTNRIYDSTGYCLYKKGELNVFQVSNFHPYHQNNNHLLVGTYDTEDGYHIVAIYNPQTGVFQPINIKNGVPNKIADNGSVCGRFWDDESNKEKGYMWTPDEGLKIFHTFLPVSINNHNQLVGMKIHPNGYTEATLWDNGKFKSIVDLIGDSEVEFYRLYDINDKGQAVGYIWGYSTPQAIILNPID